MQKTNSGKISGLLLAIIAVAIIAAGAVLFVSNKKSVNEVANLNDTSVLEANALESIKDANVRQQVKEIKGLIDQANKELDDLSKSSR